jgi:hypothetical protein
MTNDEFAWQEQYRSVLLEVNPAQLRDAIQRAEKLILERRRALEGLNHDPEIAEERRAIEDALRVLNLLKRQPAAD